MFLAGALLAGCAGEAPPPPKEPVTAATTADSCKTADCLAAVAVREYPANPRDVTGRVVQMQDEMARIVVVTALLEANVGPTGELCRALPEGMSRDRCFRINDRPHLKSFHTPRKDLPGADAAVADGSEGPTTARPDFDFPDLDIPLAEVTVPASTCEGELDRSACLDGKAISAAQGGDGATAHAICTLHTQEKWADECRFYAAEAATEALHGKGYATAAALCGRANLFQQECWSHTLAGLPESVPPPEATREQAQLAVADAALVEAAWSATSKDAAARHSDRYWASYFATSYSQSPDPDGTPFAFYPKSAWPAIRSAATMRMAALSKLSGSLAEQVAQVQARLKIRGPGKELPASPPGLVMVTVLGAPPSNVPTTFFLGPAARPYSDDAAIDVALVVLEVNARATPPNLDLLDKARTHPNALVSGEAGRLIQELAGTGWQSGGVYLNPMQPEH